MAKLAIKGHPTRGKEVINLLEMLGADRLGYKDTFVGFYYYIECEAIASSDECPIDAKVFTLEEFLEKYPYKVGDVVKFISSSGITLKSKIINMKWCNTLNKILCTLEGDYVISTEDMIETKTIPPYMDYDIKEDKETLEQIDLTRELRIADEVEVILGDYEFVLKDGKTYFVKKKPQYPKTYEECLKILGYNTFHTIPMNHGHNGLLMMKFQRLLIFRDAYWKIAGEEMGLDKPWGPDWGENDGGYRYCIRNQSNKIVLSNEWLGENYILSFPTKEMRDEFYKNFKELIEECKELL